MTTPRGLSMLSSSQVEFGRFTHAKCLAELSCLWLSKGVPLRSLTCPKAVQCLGQLPGRLRPGVCHTWHLIQGTQKPLFLGPSARSPERCNRHMSLAPQQERAQTGAMICLYKWCALQCMLLSVFSHWQAPLSRLSMVTDHAAMPQR